jgi:hypothetical protein
MALNLNLLSHTDSPIGGCDIFSELSSIFIELSPGQRVKSKNIITPVAIEAYVL